MFRLRIAATLFALVACGSDPYGIDYYTDYPFPNQLVAEAHTKKRVGKLWGLDLSNLTTVVRWTNSTCPYDDDARTAVIYRGECFHGLTFDCSNIYVAVRPTLTESALLHELGHCYRLYAGLGGDPTHRDHLWWGMIDTALKSEWRARGW